MYSRSTDVFLIFVSFSNDVGTALCANPNLVYLSSVNVDPLTYAVCFLLRVFLLRIGNCKLPLENQMGRQAAVGVWSVVGISVANVSALSQLRGCVSRQP